MNKKRATLIGESHILVDNNLVEIDLVSRMVYWINPKEQEKEMKRNVFEYCITGYNPDGILTCPVGPALIVVEEDLNSEASPRDRALLEIGRSIGEFNIDNLEVHIRPFC